MIMCAVDNVGEENQAFLVPFGICHMVEMEFWTVDWRSVRSAA